MYARLAVFEAGAKTGFTPSVSNNNLLTRFDDYEKGGKIAIPSQTLYNY
ncbi:hypothetical protein KIH39_15755 [Telmatocola sphagniphila]|uniref:Uncharacterized protein n=1 Tax=Telmatocola sphagniphila TaxID=1123043 RepID=A0A8E6ETR7_9BACT|nr:hypothetical protein [Telmatocola sphagniphila]QVL30307.1 hypothetical protein KIH39_15755 [Telmatocola sphagniphila]